MAHERMTELVGHRDLVSARVNHPCVSGGQLKALRPKIDISPRQPIEFSSSRRSMQKRQQQHPLLPFCYFNDFPEVILRRHVPRM